MAEIGVGCYYIVLQGSDNVSSPFQACLLITDKSQSAWKLISCSPDASWPGGKRRYGQWAGIGMLDGHAQFFEDGGKGKAEQLVFSLYGTLWPPDLGGWDQSKGRAATIDWRMVGSGAPAVRQGNGRWWPIISGPLVNAVKAYLAEQQKELEQLLRELPLELASLVDPTGIASLGCAVRASEKGDYLGCALNLLAAIPLFGKVAKTAEVMKVVNQAEGLKAKIQAIRGYLEWSVKWTRSGLMGRTEAKLMDARIAATTQRTQADLKAGQALLAQLSARLAKAVKGGSAVVRNSGWLKSISSARELGLLDSELKALRMLAKEGLYFVVKSCNPARVEWLNKATSMGCRLMSKPVWIKAKTLGSGKFKGLCGFLKGEVHVAVKKVPIPVEQLPQEVRANLRLLGEKPVGVYKGNYIEGFKDEMMLDHYWIETKDSFVLVNKQGAPYTADLDIVMIGRRKAGGKMGAPGEGVGPANPAVKARGQADDAQFSMHWDAKFKEAGCQYPPGYRPFGGWHGGRGGSAAFGWSPDKSDRLVVALHGIEGVADDIAMAPTWNAWKQFDDANHLGAAARMKIDPTH